MSTPTMNPALAASMAAALAHSTPTQQPVPIMNADMVPTGYSFVPFLSFQQQPAPPFTWTSNAAQQCMAEGSKCTGYTSDGHAIDKNFKKQIHYVRDPTKGTYFKNPNDYNTFCRKIGGTPADRVCQIPAAEAEKTISELIKAGMVIEPFTSDWDAPKHPWIGLLIILLVVWGLQSVKLK